MIDNTSEVLAMINNKIERKLTKVGMLVSSDAKNRAPVDLGNLRRSIEYNVNMQEKEVVIGTNTEYAPYQEFGTGIYNEDGNGRQTPWTYRTPDGRVFTTEGNKPQPFLRPAFEENIQKIREILESDE
jgi:HK97 gp10 family phage protein